MKRFAIVILGVALVGGLLLWLVPWLVNGGWPASGPVGAEFPPHILYVTPDDGEVVGETYGFCVHYDYQAGKGMDAKSREGIRYHFDGWNKTSQVYDVTELEYPTGIGELCYQDEEPLAPGWHTVKISFRDNAGNRYEYKWRFQVVED